MTTRHIVAVTPDCVEEDLAVLYVTNSLFFPTARRISGAEDVQFGVKVLQTLDNLDDLGEGWTGELDESDVLIEDWGQHLEEVRFQILDQEAHFAFEVEAAGGLTVDRLEDGMDWDLDFETDTDEALVLGSITIDVSQGLLQSME
jgi:hypothetical protein